MSTASFPIVRLLDNGLDYDNAWQLHARVSQGGEWDAAGEALGDVNLSRAHKALAAGHAASARDAFRQASMCFRFAHAGFNTDTERKRALYRRLIDAFAESAKLDAPPTQRIPVPWRGGTIHGWLMQPQAVNAPVVLIFGGADAWRETYWISARYLVERGLAAFLVDLPGQGEARVLDKVYTTADSHLALSAMADAFPGRRLAIWGNSMGGYFAVRAAAVDPRFLACCVNGGSPYPVELLQRFPAFIEKLCAMAGTTDASVALAVFQALVLREDVRCPLLVLHGMRDRIFLHSSAQALLDRGVSADKQLLVWEDGDHCLYNRAHEKHCLVADWFRERL